MPVAGIPALMRELPLRKLRGLGGKFGSTLEKNGWKTVVDVQNVPMAELKARFDDKTGHRCYLSLCFICGDGCLPPFAPCSGHGHDHPN